MLVASIVVCLGVLTLANYGIKRSVLYPPFLFCLMWFLALSLYSLQIIETDPLHVTTLSLVALGAFLFSVGGGIALLLPSPIIDTRVVLWPGSMKPSRDHFMKYLYLGIMILAMVLTVRHTVAAGLANEGGAGSILGRARLGTIEGAEEAGGSSGFSLLGYMPTWTIFTAVLFAIERRNRLFWITAGVAFVTAVFTTGRGPILLLFSSVTTVFLIQANRTRFTDAVKFARVPIIVFFSLYIGLIFTTKITAGIEGGALGIAVYYVVSYIVGPMAALDYVIEHPRLYSNEVHHTFKFPLLLATKLHLLQYDPPPMLDTFVAVPFPTNVYTGYKFFYTDFGFAGTLAVALIIGLLHTLLYRKAVQRTVTGAIRSEFGLFCFAVTIMTLMMFIFDDLYSALGVHLTVLLFGGCYFAMRHVTPISSESATEAIQTSTVA